MVATKALLLLSTALLAGSALAPTLVGVAPSKRFLRLLTFALVVAVIGLSALEIATNLRRLLGFLDWDNFYYYLRHTRHGNAALLRAGSALLLGASLQWRPAEGLALPKAALALALLLSFSYSSHAAAMGGFGPMIVDWLHFVAVAAWLGALLFVASSNIWSPWTHATRVEAVARLSAIGLAAVAAMAVTGVVSTLVHLANPATFMASPYAESWLRKVIVVATVVACAIWNRVRLVPLTRQDDRSTALRAGILVELALLGGVFVATGWLTTSALPHSADAGVNAFENLQGFIEYLKERSP